MISVQKVIFPGIAAGVFFLVFVTSLIASPKVALASNTSPAVETAGTPAPSSQTANEAAQQDQAAPENPAPAKQEKAAQPENNPPKNEGCSLSSAIPETVRQWCGLIERYAGEQNLDPNLVAAMITQESGGNPNAYSKSGAVGLMQVMPKDGLAAGFMCINGPCFSSRPSSQELYDPEFNIAYGTRMISGLINKHGDVREALRAYGPMNMGYRYADIILSIMNRYQ